MTEVTGTPAPGADAGGGTPAPAPTAPVTPPAPTPATPTPPAAPTAPELTPDEQAAKAEDDEWDASEKDIFPGLKSTKKKESKNEPAKPDEKPKDGEASPENPEGKKPNEGEGASDDSAAKSGEAEEAGDKPADDDAAAAARATRGTTREYARQQEVMRNDVRTKMYADAPQTLVDRDGDPINGIEDVMQLKNPRTGEAFTEEEAGQWLLSAQQQFNQNKAEQEKEIDRIADLQLDIKDQVDSVNSKYGAYLQEHTDIRDDLWAEFQESLTTDEKSGIVTAMPMSLAKFYERALGPLVNGQPATPPPVTPALTAAPEKTAEQIAEEEAQAKREAEVKKQANRADRSDVYTPPSTKKGAEDEGDDEWAEAERNTFGRQIKK